ncbi:pyridoxamine 5'-phosphate oxidase family protein [Marinobacter nauticus]
MSSPEHKQKIWKLIRDIKACMLTTRHGDELRSRPMVLVQDEYDGTLSCAGPFRADGPLVQEHLLR